MIRNVVAILAIPCNQHALVFSGLTQQRPHLTTRAEIPANDSRELFPMHHRNLVNSGSYGIYEQKFLRAAGI